MGRKVRPIGETRVLDCGTLMDTDSVQVIPSKGASHWGGRCEFLGPMVSKFGDEDEDYPQAGVGPRTPRLTRPGERCVGPVDFSHHTQRQ